MKRTVVILSLIFSLAIALSVSIPTLANSDTDVTIITGTIRGTIDITAHPDDFALSNMVPGTPTESAALTVTVKSNKGGWTLGVAETSGGDGFMANASTPLTNPLMVKGGDQTPYVGLNTSPQLETNGAKTTGIGISDIKFAQTADWADDAALTYTISVTFTATVAD